jgi:hypothetical protein
MPRDRVNQDKKVTFRLDSFRLDALGCQADRQGVTVSSIVRHLVIRYLDECRRQEVLS